MATNSENKAKSDVPTLPVYPTRAARVVTILPLFPVGAFLIFAGWNAPQAAYAAIVLTVPMALCLCGPEILAFPNNARAELEHGLALARCAGTSWFPDIRAQGRRALLTLGRLCFSAAQQRDHWVSTFGIAAVIYVAVGVGIAASAAMGRLDINSALWSGATSASVSGYLFYLAARYRKFGPVGPDEERLLEVANLHQLCDQERRAELLSLIRKG